MKRIKTLLTFILVLALAFLVALRGVNAEATLVPLVVNDKNINYYGTQTQVMIPSEYIPQEREFRAAWVSRYVSDIGDLTTETKFKNSFIDVLNKAEQYNLNAIIFHVRTHHDAFYRSNLNKQSSYVGNVNQTFDALAWAIEETHKRGIEFHAWLNPYRIKSSGSVSHSSLVAEYAAFPDNPVHNPDNVLFGTSVTILNPGEPAVREFLIDTVMELIENYDVDAIHFDDYFYADGVNDSKTYNKPGYNPNKLSLADWRREQVNIFIRDLSQAIRNFNIQNNRYVQLGISPTGIYKNASRGFAYGIGSTDYYDENENFITKGSNTSGQEHYASYLYADTKKWIDNEWIDYILPQTYWGFTRAAAPYADLVEWWANVVKHKKVNLYTGIGIYMASSGATDDSWLSNPYEIEMQIRYNSKIPEIKGASIYSFKHLFSPPGESGTGLQVLKNNIWNKKVLRPVIRTIARTPLGEVQNFIVERSVNQNILTWDHLPQARGYVIYRNAGEINFDDYSQILDIVGFENISELTYIDNNVTRDDYVYGIRALDGANQLGTGTVEEIEEPIPVYTTTVSSYGAPQELIQVLETNSLYGNTNIISVINNHASYRYNFITENGKIVSYEPNYYFRVTDNHHFVAYFTPQNKLSVSYIDLNNDLISFQIVNSLAEAVAPPNPSDIGLYQFAGWTETILETGDVIYRAIYNRTNELLFMVSIYDGINSYQELVPFGQTITITSPYPGQKIYWLVDGEVYSFSETLEITIYNDISISLVLGETNEGFIHLRENVVSQDDYFIYFGKFNLPASTQLIETGILLTDDFSDQLVLSNQNITKLRALSISPNNEFSIRKSGLIIGDTLYARAYLVYFDDINGITILYSPIYTHTKEIVYDTYYITYELNGGTLVGGKTQFNINDLPYTLPIPIKDGYVFAGWHLSNDFSGNPITQITEAKNITIYARWIEVPQVQQYNIIYNLNGGTWGFNNKEELIQAFLADFHSYLIFIGVSPTTDLQTFMHGEGNTSGYNGPWVNLMDYLYSVNDKSSDASKQYFINQPEYNAKWLEFFDFMENWVKIVNSDQSFWNSIYTGKQRLRQYIQNERPNGNEKEADMYLIPMITRTATTYRNDRELILAKPIREGYIFGGWYETSNFEGTAIDRIYPGTQGDKVLYAKWEAVVEPVTEYTITYELDGGHLENPIYIYTVNDLPLILPIPTKTDFVFVGWYLNSDFSGESITVLTEVGNVTLYARWKMSDELVLQNIVGQIPKHITYDYDFPTYPGLSFRYHEMHINDDVVFDLETGQLLTLRVTKQTRIIVATLNESIMTFVVDFGVVKKDQVGSYYRNDPYIFSLDEPNKGNEHYGWSGYTLTKGNKVHFIYYAIELTGSGLITNTSILNPSYTYISLGTLYINVGQSQISFQISSLGNRVDTSVSASLVIIGADGSILQVINSNGINTNTLITLNPGESFWTAKFLDRSDLEFGKPDDFNGYDYVYVTKYNIDKLNGNKVK